MQHHVHLWILSAQDRDWNKIHASLSVGCVCERILNNGSLIAKCHLLGIVSPCGIVSGSEMFHLFHLKLNYIFLLLPAFFRLSLRINSEYLDFPSWCFGDFCCCFVINTCFGICLFWWITSMHPVHTFLYEESIFQSIQGLYHDCSPIILTIPSFYQLTLSYLPLEPFKLNVLHYCWRFIVYS